MVIRNLDVTVYPGHLCFLSYPAAYPPRSALEHISPRDIELIFVGIVEFQILLRSGAVLLFPKEKELALCEFVRTHRIRVLGGSDPWMLLCEPFLDTEFTPEIDRSTTQRLNEVGFDHAEIKAIRERIAPQLFGTWEWQVLGFLEVVAGHKRAPEEFFHWVFSICRRGYAHAKPCELFSPRSADGCSHQLHDEVSRLSGRAEFEEAQSATKRLAAQRKPRWWHFSWARAPTNAQIAAQSAAQMDAWRAQYQKLQDVQKWLLHQYTEPHRRYHNVEQLLRVMSLLRSLKPEATTAVLLAALFHDAIHAPHDGSNEERSAAAMREQLGPLALSPALLDAASELILYTRDHCPTDDPEEQAIHDADLGIFGLGPDLYAAYAAGIREEHASMPDALFRAGRKKTLQDFFEKAGRGRFFYRLDPIFEPQVVRNLEWELSQLDAPGELR